jgi:hypothetical protein
MSSPVRVKFGIEELHVMLLSNYVFRESDCSKFHAFLEDDNEISLSCIHISSDFAVEDTCTKIYWMSVSFMKIGAVETIY